MFKRALENRGWLIATLFLGGACAGVQPAARAPAPSPTFDNAYLHTRDLKVTFNHMTPPTKVDDLTICAPMFNGEKLVGQACVPMQEFLEAIKATQAQQQQQHSAAGSI